MTSFRIVFLLIVLLLAGLWLGMSSEQILNPKKLASCPVESLETRNIPQFVVLSFDDNTTVSGVRWALDLFEQYQNPAGSNQVATFDGLSIRTSFYNNSIGLESWQQDDPAKLAESYYEMYRKGHEVANHTHNHHADLIRDDDLLTQRVNALNKTEWKQRIQYYDDVIESKSGISAENIVGFRAPFLIHSDEMLAVLKQQNRLYDSSIEVGYDSQHTGSNLPWPYQFNRDDDLVTRVMQWLGFQQSKSEDENALWELPNYVLMIPDDSHAERYQFDKGLRERIANNIPNHDGLRITGFDYNLWVKAKLTKPDVLAILKYNLDLRFQGNRAPFTLGLHSQYYTSEEWQQNHAPQVSLDAMQATIREFIEYALNHPDVRIRSARDVIKWCQQPVELSR